MFPLYDDNPSTRTPYVTFALIVVNLAVMLWLSQLSQLDEQLEVIRHGFIPQRIQQLSNPNLVLQIPMQIEPPQRDIRVVQQPQKIGVVQIKAEPVQVLSTLLTTMFLHGGWMHVLGNMWFLWIFGNNIEDRLGSLLYLVFYLVGGLLATACHWAYSPLSTTPVIGASGAVATILGAYAVTFPKAKVRTLIFFGFITTVDIPAFLWLGFWLGSQLFSAFFVGKDLTVAVWAHIGGFAAGAFLMPILSAGISRPQSPWHDDDDLNKQFLFPPNDGR